MILLTIEFAKFAIKILLTINFLRSLAFNVEGCRTLNLTIQRL